MKRSSFLAVIMIAAAFVTLLPGHVQARNKIHAQDSLPAGPQNLQIPAMAHDEHSVVLVWNKPDKYNNIVNYRVYVNGRSYGLSSKNNKANSPASTYFNKFYSDDHSNFHLKITYLSFTVKGLRAHTKYSFTVRAVYKNGKESPVSNTVIHTTIAKPKIFSIKDFGAQGDGVFLNTYAIQNAINACTPGSVVLIPIGIYRTGALFLKSDMTLKLEKDAVLLGSDNPAEYPIEQGYTLYPYSTNKRPPSLINALSDNREAGTFRNIRIVGKGTIDGNGWKSIAPTRSETGKEIPTISAGEKNNVLRKGILAKSQVEAALDGGAILQIAYGQRRSSLITLRGVENVYVSGITTLNPSFHGIMFLQCKNATLNGVVHMTNDGGNADGVEFGNSENIYAFNNFFDTGDDCLNFASGTGFEAEKQPPMKKGHIFNNYFRRGHGAVVMGSHTGAWIGNILAEDNIINGTDIALRCKSTDFNGGGARDIIFRDNALKNIERQGFLFTLDYSDPNADYDYSPANVGGQFKDITVKNITFDKSHGTDASIEFKGDTTKETSLENISFENITMKEVNPACISALKNGRFYDVRFISVKGSSKPWVILKGEQLLFTGETPKP
jgi:exo-poly-alpha-galacturonosidase